MYMVPQSVIMVRKLFAIILAPQETTHRVSPSFTVVFYDPEKSSLCLGEHIGGDSLTFRRSEP